MYERLKGSGELLHRWLLVEAGELRRRRYEGLLQQPLRGDLAARVLCPRSWLSLVLPHAVCRGPGTSHNLNDHDHDEMKVRFEHCFITVRSLWPLLIMFAKDVSLRTLRVGTRVVLCYLVSNVAHFAKVLQQLSI